MVYGPAKANSVFIIYTNYILLHPGIEDGMSADSFIAQNQGLRHQMIEFIRFCENVQRPKVEGLSAKPQPQQAPAAKQQKETELIIDWSGKFCSIGGGTGYSLHNGIPQRHKFTDP